jgi:hypothetical protein
LIQQVRNLCATQTAQRQQMTQLTIRVQLQVSAVGIVGKF